MFGSRDDISSNSFSVNVGGSTSNAYTSYGNTGNITYSILDTNRHVIDKNKNLFYVDGELILTQPNVTFASTGSLEIFASYHSGTQGYLPSISRIYSFKIFDNGVLVRDYRKSDGAIGMYDVVNDVLYRNSGTGIFIKGNEI